MDLARIIAVTLVLVGLVLIAFGTYLVVKDRSQTTAAGKALGVELTTPLSGFVILMGVLCLGGAGYLALQPPATDTKKADGATRSLSTPSSVSITSIGPTTTAYSPSATATSSSPPSKATVCRSAANALLQEAHAINVVISQVVPSTELPTSVRSDYASAAANEAKVNSATEAAWDAYAAVLLPPTDENIPTILHDVTTFIDRLPGEISGGPRSQLDADWAALNDRPKVLSEKIATAVLHQCGTV